MLIDRHRFYMFLLSTPYKNITEFNVLYTSLHRRLSLYYTRSKAIVFSPVLKEEILIAMYFNTFVH